jgi:hypothetical protein
LVYTTSHTEKVSVNKLELKIVVSQLHTVGMVLGTHFTSPHG